MDNFFRNEPKCIIDSKGMLIRANDEFYDMIDYSKDEFELIYENKILDIVHEDDLKQFEIMLYASVDEMNKPNIRLLNRHKNLIYTVINISKGNKDKYLNFCVFKVIRKHTPLIYDEVVSYLKKLEEDVFELARVNLQDNKVEYLRMDPQIHTPITKGMDYDTFIDAISSEIANSKERANALKRFSREYLLNMYEQGIYTTSIIYQQLLASGIIIWVKTTIKLVKDPLNNKILGFIYAKNSNRDKIEFTDYSKHLKKLHIAIDTLYSFVLVLNYNNGMYDVIQTQCVNIPLDMQGTIVELTNYMYCCLTEESIDCVNVIRNVDLLKSAIENKESLVYEVYSDICGIQQWSEYKIIPVDDNGSDNNLFLLLSLNIDERKEKERKIKKALKQANEASRAKEQFLAHMSHEIRTPLNGIVGMLELMKKCNNKQCSNDYLNKAIISSRHLTGLINDILDMSKIESECLILREDTFSFDDLTEYLDAVIKPMAEEKKIHFEQIYDYINGLELVCDGNRLKQIMINLLTNAVRYTNEGGKVKFKMSISNPFASIITTRFVIIDNGIGMEKSFIEKAFTPFEQEERCGKMLGTGLGLSITKRIVELMKGTIEINTCVNKGTIVIVEIPFKNASNSNFLKTITENNVMVSKEPRIYKGKRVLLVEDNELNQEIAQLQLETFKCEVEIANNGEEAVKKFVNSPIEYYDIIFMDVMMPKVNGLDATKLIRKLPRRDARKVPIVAMTANAFAEDIDKSLQSGMNYHLSKPFGCNDMEKILNLEFTG